MKRKATISAVLLLAATLLAACGPQEAERPPDEVNVRLKWTHQTQFAGMYAAHDKGFYADENIKATFHPGGQGTSPIDLVLTGADDFGITSAGEDEIGWMRAEVWQGMQDTLLEQGLLDGPVDVEDVYTIEFLQKVYGGEE